MFASGLSVPQQLDRLQGALGLEAWDQDWGICNADALRVPDFIAFFEKEHDQHWLPATVGEYVDLVLESACDALHAHPDFALGCLDQFVMTVARIVPERVGYWTEHEWPGATHLRGLGV